MKNFTSFSEEIKNAIAYAMPCAELKLTTVNKSSGSYEGLTVSTDKTGICPVLNLSAAYQQYEDGTPIDTIIDGLLGILASVRKPSIDKSMLLDFEAVKGRIFPRLINTSAHSDYLETHPHKEIEDLSITYAVRVEETADGIAEAVIDYNLQEHWNVCTEDIHEAAMANISRISPVFGNIEDMLFNQQGGAVEDAKDIDEVCVPLYILTTPTKCKGATMVLNAKVMESIIDRFGEIYIIPSSVDEVLILPKTFGRDVSDLVKMVKEVNASEVRPEDRLSDNVYEYDIKTGRIAIAV
ncbi:MAG: DUF5688 family protein [Clostridia bacterium]|nr:DUF5688 family protein [Clostridia bacterium]